VQHFWPEFGAWLDALPDTRYQPYVEYSARFLLWWGLSLFLCKLGSRRQLDFDLRDLGTHVLANLNRVAGTAQRTLPVHDTLDHFLGHLGAAPLAALRAHMLRRLIRMKALEGWRLAGRFVVAVDGTGHLHFARRHCPQCLVRHHATHDVYLHMVEEAKLVGPGGLALSVGTAFIENPPGRADAGPRDTAQQQQDCELTALARLVPALKRDFPQTPFCVTSDALYACGAAIALAIRLSSKGPILYMQERIGLNNRPFSVVKFRSLVDGAEVLVVPRPWIMLNLVQKGLHLGKE